MHIDEVLIRKVAKIARLELSDEEVSRFVPELGEVLGAFEVLRKADVHGASRAVHPVPIAARLRKDVPGACLSQDKALSLTVHRQDGYFKGPKAIKG